MNSRRKFIKNVGLAASGALLLPHLNALAAGKSKKFGIQLYSLRNELPKGVDKVLSEISKAGYSSIEAYGFSLESGFFGLKASEFKSLLDKHNLLCPSAHYDFKNWEQSQDEKILQAYIHAAHTLKSKYVVIPHMTPDIFKNEEQTKHFIKKMNKASKVVKDAGLKLAYHNHDIEFYPLPANKTALSIMLKETDPELVDFELDLYWVVRAKHDPIQLFKEHPGRFTMWHIKDMSKADSKKNTEIGNGSIDFTSLAKYSKLAGLKLPFVEQENFDIDPYESIRKSAASVKLLKL